MARNTALYVMPAGGGDATRLSDVETMDLACNGRIELRGPDSALVLNNARGTVELLEFRATGSHAGCWSTASVWSPAPPPAEDRWCSVSPTRRPPGTWPCSTAGSCAS